MSTAREIKPASGKLGILTPGMGAVATTFYAGVLSARKGLSKPIGSASRRSSSTPTLAKVGWATLLAASWAMSPISPGGAQPSTATVPCCQTPRSTR